ncbi:MAG: NADH-quinone oxidoreductase subunit N [Candidatus Omnitrophota bacterium]|nr:NADH-quinone oxidoreductase subunit N [Candidatus Omnitrophota bacterium]
MNIMWSLLIPEWTVFAFLMILLFGEMFSREFSGKLASQVTFLGSFVTLIACFSVLGVTDSTFGGSFMVDSLATFFKIFFAITLIGVVPMCHEFFDRRLKNPGEFYLVLWSSLLGLFFLVSANDLLLLFIALEIFTLSLYIMAAYLKHELLSIEAGLKYLILGSLASAFMIYGISLIYVSCGSTSFPVIREVFALRTTHSLILLGILFILSGVCFKVAAVPFQFWVPDVYEGAPTPVVAYLSVASKAAGFAILLKLLFTVFIPFEAARTLMFSVLAAMTILYGNLGALVQTNIKRLFGYSSIGHAGYLLIGIAVGGEAGTSALLYYLVAYGLTNIAAFIVITEVGRRVGSDKIDAYRGLAKRSPFLAGTFFVALLSLAGVPPLAGFFGKFLVLLAAVRGGLGWLALLGALAVAISLFYYLSLVRMMYIEESSSEQAIGVSPVSRFLLVILTASIILVGFWQEPVLSFTRTAVHALF